MNRPSFICPICRRLEFNDRLNGRIVFVLRSNRHERNGLPLSEKLPLKVEGSGTLSSRVIAVEVEGA